MPSRLALCRIRTPGSAALRAAAAVLRLYLALVLAGCASSHPAPGVTPPDDLRNRETRTVSSDYDATFRASLHALQDLHYTVDTVDRDAGVIVASRETRDEEAAIEEETAPGAETHHTPTWVTVLLIVTGVILIVGLIALLSGDHSDDHHDTAFVGGGGVVGDHGPTTYRYAVTLNLESIGPEATSVRVSATGQERKGREVKKVGVVRDPRFFEDVHEAIRDALRAATATEGTAADGD